MSEQLLTPEQVAQRCGLSRRAVYDAIRRGELPAMRLCNRLRIRPDLYDAWLTAGTLTPPTTRRLCATPPSPPSATGSFKVMMNNIGGKETK